MVGCGVCGSEAAEAVRNDPHMTLGSQQFMADRACPAWKMRFAPPVQASESALAVWRDSGANLGFGQLG